MWQSTASAAAAAAAAGPISASSNPLYRQIQHGTHPVQTSSITHHGPSTMAGSDGGGGLANPQDRQPATARSAIPDDMAAAQIWIDQIKRRRILTSLLINAAVQSLLVLIANLRPTIYFWRAISIANLLYLIVFLCLQETFVVVFIRHVKVIGQYRPGIHRLFSMITNPSTFCCYALTVVSSLWAIIFTQPLSSWRCFSNRMILFSSVYFIRRLITQSSFRFPPLQLPLDCQIRSRTPLVLRSGLRYTLIFTLVWHLFPFGLIRFFLQMTPLGVFARLLTSYEGCHFSISSELSCIITCLMLFASWEFSRIVLETVLMQSILTDKATSVSVSVLVKVLQQSRDPYTRSLGFLELSDVCNISPEARITVFRSDDQTVWAAVLKVCLDSLNEFSKSLYRACEPENRRRAKSQICLYFSGTDDLIHITQALSSLVVHSIEEDEMGLVQRSFEDILGALLAASIAIEDFMRAFFDNFELSAGDKDHLYIDREGRVDITLAPLALNRAIDRALYRIIFKFYRYLKNFSFPQEYGLRLRQYAEFQ